MGDDDLQAEQRARRTIDVQLTAAGWHVQSQAELDLSAGTGIAVREKVMAPGHGRSDYLLYLDKRAVGVIEAKAAGTTLAGVTWQSAKYATGLPAATKLRAVTLGDRLPFVFEASGSETFMTNGYDPVPWSRQLFSSPRPETLARTVRTARDEPGTATWRGKVRTLPPLDTTGLRPAQIEAITGIERSLVEQRHDRSLVQMATGAGKTYTAVTTCFRLLRYGGFRRILFLVDRNNLATQALGEFQNYAIPGDGRRFTEVHNVDLLTGAGMVESSSVVISTIQRVHAALNGEQVSADDDPGLDGYVPDQPVSVAYSAALPPEAFDLVRLDEAHRSIYGEWLGVLTYFDAHLVGLTATPVKRTFGFFRQNLVSEYTYPQSVADNVNVDFDVYRIRTEISEQGSTIEAGTVVPKVDRRTRVQRYETLDDDVTYTATQLDRAVTSKNQIRLVLETFRDRLFTEIFPGRSTVPKTLVFCKDDNHAEEVVRTVREVFGAGDDFAAKITYAGQDPKGDLKKFRTSATLRVAVTVDMIATGTDVRPLECVFFLRDVKSAAYFEQMKGRGSRTIPPTDFQLVTPDADRKDRFVLVDAVGVTEHAHLDATPLERRRSVSLERLLQKAAAYELDEDETASLASRLAKLEFDLTPTERGELDELAGGSLRDVVRRLVAAVDPDEQAKVRAASPGDPDAAVATFLDDAVDALASNPVLRQRILDLRRTHDQVIDEGSVDVLLDAYGVVDTDRARSVVTSWRAYLEENRSEITALQLLFDSQAPAQRVSYAELAELAERIKRPPHNWTPDLIWQAYAAIDVEHVRRSDRHTVTDLVSLVRFATGADDVLAPYAARVSERYQAWLLQQEQAGTVFTERQRWWLDRMAEVIATSAGVTVQDLDNVPFSEHGGVDGAVRDLGPGAGAVIETLNRELTA